MCPLLIITLPPSEPPLLSLPLGHESYFRSSPETEGGSRPAQTTAPIHTRQLQKRKIKLLPVTPAFILYGGGLGSAKGNLTAISQLQLCLFHLIKKIQHTHHGHLQPSCFVILAIMSEFVFLLEITEPGILVDDLSFSFYYPVCLYRGETKATFSLKTKCKRQPGASHKNTGSTLN